MSAQTYAEHLLESLDQEPAQPAISVDEIQQDTDVRYVDELFRDVAERSKDERAEIVRYRHAQFRTDNCAREHLDYLDKNGYILLLDESMRADRFWEIVSMCRSDLVLSQLPEWLLPDDPTDCEALLPDPIDFTKPLDVRWRWLLSLAYRRILGPGFEDAFDEGGYLRNYDEETLKKRLAERGVLKENGAADHQVICRILTTKD